MPPLPTLFLMIALSVFAANSKASQFCFSVAKTYNEQLYCEIEASGAGKSLPSFDQFQKNTPLIQSLLLKPYAKKLGLKIKTATQTTTPQATTPKAARQSVTTPSHSATDNHADLSHCHFKSDVIICDKKHYRFIGNQSNESLRAGVLGADNRMQLPVFEKGELDSYLVKAYKHYLNKMIEIGLAGATLHYGNFEYIFHDLRAQEIDFSQRFETMYRYLKKDKRNISINKSTAPSGLTAKDCFLLDKLLVCSRGRSNYIYRS